MGGCSALASPEPGRLSVRARCSARLVRMGTTRPSASMSTVATSRLRLNSSAETTRTIRPWASRIVTGAIDSSPEGSRTTVQEGFMAYASYRESEPLTPTPGTRIGAELEARVTIEAQGETPQRRLQRPARGPAPHRVHVLPTAVEHDWLRPADPDAAVARCHRRSNRYVDR